MDWTESQSSNLAKGFRAEQHQMLLTDKAPYSTSPSS